MYIYVHALKFIVNNIIQMYIYLSSVTRNQLCVPFMVVFSGFMSNSIMHFNIASSSSGPNSYIVIYIQQHQ